MKKWILVFYLALTLNAFKLDFDRTSQKPILQAKIPPYIGAGYNALSGNPYANRDQGFKFPIFKLTYETGSVTQDGRYFIPDFTSASQNVSCSLNSKVKIYSGTQNYQKQLSNIANFDSKYEDIVMNAKFSSSSAFQSFVKNVISKNQFSIQSNAQCSVYTVEMPIYTNQIQLSADFIEGVRQSYANNEWQSFLNYFGSHYATSVTYGARYFLQHTYSEQSISLFKSLKIDLSFTAQSQFFNSANISMSDDLKKYSNQTQVVNSKVEYKNIAIIGELPPRGGNWIDWANMVKLNLGPISYRLSAITILFNYIPGLDALEAIKSFTTFFNAYCKRTKCPPVTPDRPDPKPLSVVLSKGPQIMGNNKTTIRYDTNDGHITVGMKICQVLMGFNENFASVQFILSDGINQHALAQIGNAPINKKYLVPLGDELKCMRFGVHRSIKDSNYLRFSTVQFTTKGGVQSQIFKGSIAPTEYRTVCVQTIDLHIVGMYGSFDNGDHVFDSIGLNFMKEVMR